MNYHKNKAWHQYESGKAYKRRIGLYESARKNQAFYRGEQWSSNDSSELPHPVFNIIRRVVDYLVCSVATTNLSIRFTDENLPFYTRDEREQSEALITALNTNTAYRWERSAMDSKIFSLLTDAAVVGDGALYCYWDPYIQGAGEYSGDIVTDIADATCIFPSDVNKHDIQSQEYVIISGRSSVLSLRREARENGVPEDDVAKIVRDDDFIRTGEFSSLELEGEDEEKATFIIKFWRENGEVCFEKSTRDCVIKRAHTSCRLYPIVTFSWTRSKDSFHGSSPVSSMIPNQKFINRAYAMAMKHMTDTAFSKVIYDKSRIPEWSNEIGEAIAAMGGGNISDAVSVVGTGEMQSGFMELINSAVTLTKELMGATESALGNMEARNTSAILALQETSRIALDNVRYSYYESIEQLAAIWVDMICAYYGDGRLLPCKDGVSVSSRAVDAESLRKAAISARVDVTEITRYSAVASQNILDKLLDKGYITPAEYVRRLPAGLIQNKEALIEELELRKEGEHGYAV